MVRLFPENEFIALQKGFRCTHNTMAQYNKKEGIPHVKHTECKADLSITVKNFNMKWYYLVFIGLFFFSL